MDSSETLITEEPKEKCAGGQEKLNHSVESMINQMKLTEDEIIYRMQNFDNVDVFKEYFKYLKCTRCEKNFQTLIKKGKVTVHPLLGVLMCDACCDYYGDGNFSLDSEGEDKYCRWCGDGGVIFACSKCICGFCKKCIKKHFGVDGLRKIENDDDWVCYFCNSKPLWDLRSICSLAEQASKNIKEELKSKKYNKGRKSADRKKGNDEDLQRDISSDSCESLNNDLKNRKTQLKSFKKAANETNLKCGSPLLKRQKFNETKKIKSKRKSRKWAKGSGESDNEEESTESESRNPKKKTKVARSSSGSESDNEESSSFKNKKSRVLEKLRGIWKLTESTTEVGFNSSQERLERLSNPKSFPTIESLQKEFKKLELLTTFMNYFLNTARNSLDSLTGDFTFENAKDERLIFRSQETKIKAIAKKLLQDSDDENVGKESSEAEDGVADGESSEEEEEKRKKEKKIRSSIGSGENEESGKEDVEESGSDENSGDKAESNSKSLGKSEAEVNNSEQAKPMIKVKSFAKMLGDNVLENKVVDVEEVEEAAVEDSEKKPSQVDEYHVDTDTDKEEDENEKKKKDENKKASGSSSENEECKIVSKRNKKKEADKIKASFEKFKKSLREKFLKKVKQEKEKKLERKKEKKEEEEKEEKKSEAEEKEEEKNEAEEKKEKEAEVLNSDGDSEESGKKEVKRSRRRKRIIASSDEEENGEKADNEDNEEKSGESNKEKEENDSDFQIQSPKISSGETSSDEATRKQSKYKRIRKKRNKGSSSDRSDGDDDDDGGGGGGGGKKKKGRKDIKKILKKDSLHVETKEALKNEEERRKRLEERQKLFHELFPEDEESKRLILDFDPETKEPLISVHKKLVKKLKPHQMKGVKFMWDNCFESVQRLEEEDTGSGCILAHCMGLGKTLQVVTLVHTVMTQDLGVNTVLIVCPLSTVKNWINEFETWLQNIHTEPITLYELVKYKKQEDRYFHLKDWQENGGVLVVSYDLFRTLTKALLKPTKAKAKTRKKAGKMFEMAFHDPGPDLVICDEGHLLKNEDTALSKCMSLIKTSRRIVLTGTPLQNNLLEYHCMVQFVKPNILGTKKEFMNRFVNPINNGQFEDSTELDVKIMKRRSHVLHSMLKGCVQRFDYSVLTPFLPEKHEYVLSISLTETQAKAYRHFVASLSGKASGGTRSTTLFNDYHHLQRIWTHPRAMLLHGEKVTRDDVESEGSIKDFVVDSDESTEESSSSVAEEVAPTKRRILRSNADDPEVRKAIEEEEKEAVKNWWDDYFKESDYDDVRASNKLAILFSLLERCGERKDKVLVFSQSLYSLDLIEYFLGKIDKCSDRDESDEFLAGNSQRRKDSWVLGADYFRLDGSTSSENRSIWCKYFNRESNPRARLFLISTRAGGLGINLYGANRVVIFDASWNPSHDLQSIFRVYRFGQKKPCFVYRFLAEATMEEKIYKRQVTKLSLAHRVVDEHQIERHYSMMNLTELYDYDPTPKESRKLPRLPKDEVFADLLSDFKEEIASYHEHDSLLENREEEELSEEERKAAWKEYEDEKVIKAASFDQLLYQQHLQAMVQAQAQAQARGVVPEIIEIGNNGPARIVNPTFLNLVQGNPGQSFVNPMYVQSSIPSNILLRGSQLGVTPFFNESTESFFDRVKTRERWMQGPRET